jgi:hypothetical protein
VGAGLLAKAVCQIQIFDLTRRFREQAHSHKFSAAPGSPPTHKSPVGAGLFAKAAA